MSYIVRERDLDLDLVYSELAMDKRNQPRKAGPRRGKMQVHTLLGIINLVF